MLRLIPNRHSPPACDRPNICPDEYALLKRIAEGDAMAFEAFYKQYYPRLFRFILRTTRQPELVEELIQETLLVVWQKADAYNRSSQISTWVFGIAYRKTLKVLAQKNRHEHELDIADLADSIGDPAANPAGQREHADWLKRALATLSADQRAVIELTFYNGLSYQEVARILDCPENTVKTRMFHARKKLQDFAARQET
ncbi:sigma-70 family RNA polymerase sigma factor [Methylomonas sp. EFPC3]|uniref:RNA polymerase sigma factor n=1 Tax=Methylomonas sp. EFPC3 TaxID=3021710 RepID=UPI0024171C7C|nr:sigma-70 family RNA polymerase sigma factor [Methylomonas sp. EFPC3]WFP49420.1 sigma-70 family RNA polymerase sigma factor [Methylomonas sp. EFPC3]